MTRTNGGRQTSAAFAAGASPESKTPAPIDSGGDLLNPPLPYAIGPRAVRAIGDIQLQQFVSKATIGKDTARIAAFADVFGERYDALRHHAGGIKQHTLDHLDVYLRQWIARATAAGAQVHLANDAAAANAICVDIARRHGCKLCVKSKSMVTEETRLVPALESAGIETIETDLGEFILQLDGDAPSHIVTPMIHKDRAAVGRSFARRLGAAYTENPETLTMIAREHLRRKYREADLGVSGGNFLVADTGSLVLCTNEGNGRFCTSIPPIHIAVVGIEKLIPRMEHLPVFLKLLARSSTAQPLTCYTSILTGPRRAGERDGPREMHVVLLDNGRTELLRRETRELLRCIRCGACLNACPVYRKIGGHAYGAVYSGPIGAVITPLLRGLANYSDLPHASSLCGACYQACPVAIDIPKHLIRLRREMNLRGIGSNAPRWVMRAWSAVLLRPRLYRAAMMAMRFAARVMRSASNAAWISRLPGPLAGWTDHRDLPMPAEFDFRSWWMKRAQEREPGPAVTATPVATLPHRANHGARAALGERRVAPPVRGAGATILHRIDAALGRQSDAANGAGSGMENGVESGDGTAAAPPVDESLARTCHASTQCVSRFSARAAAVGMEVHRVIASDAAARVVQLLAQAQATIVQCTWQRNHCHDNIETSLAAAGITVDRHAEPAARSFDAHAGLTSAHAGIAETGSLVLICDKDCARSASLVPPMHIAILPGSRILPDLLDVWPDVASSKPGALASQMLLITGPSKTADIEGVLIRGVHGPRDVHIVLLEDA